METPVKCGSYSGLGSLPTGGGCGQLVIFSITADAIIGARLLFLCSISAPGFVSLEEAGPAPRAVSHSEDAVWLRGHSLLLAPGSVGVLTP